MINTCCVCVCVPACACKEFHIYMPVIPFPKMSHLGDSCYSCTDHRCSPWNTRLSPNYLIQGSSLHNYTQLNSMHHCDGFGKEIERLTRLHLYTLSCHLVYKSQQMQMQMRNSTTAKPAWEHLGQTSFPTMTITWSVPHFLRHLPTPSCGFLLSLMVWYNIMVCSCY
jgi:hypothetical protein